MKLQAHKKDKKLTASPETGNAFHQIRCDDFTRNSQSCQMCIEIRRKCCFQESYINSDRNMCILGVLYKWTSERQ